MNNSTKVFANNNNTSLTRQIWRYDPLYHTEVKLFIKDILNLKHVQYEIKDKSGTVSPVSIFYYDKSNRPIQFVDIIGIIRAIDIVKQRVAKYFLDDGSSTIECVMFMPEDNSTSASAFTPVSSVLNKFNISELVRVIGVINEYRIREIKIYHMEKIEDPNEELLRWTDIIHLKKNVYCREYDVPPQDIQGKGFSIDKPLTITSNKFFWHNISSNNTSRDDVCTSTQSIVVRSSQSNTVKARYNEEALKEYVKEYIEVNELNEFRFSRIVEVPILQQIAIKILQSQGREIMTTKVNKQGRGEIRNLFKKILKNLVQDENYLKSDQNLVSFMVVKGKKIQ